MNHLLRVVLSSIVIASVSTSEAPLPAQDFVFPPEFLRFRSDYIVVRSRDDLKGIDHATPVELIVQLKDERHQVLSACAVARMSRIRIGFPGRDESSAADLDPLLVNNPYLRELTLYSIDSVEDLGENPQHDFSKLKVLELVDSALDEKAARRIAAFPALETVSLRGSDITELAVAELLKSKTIRTLDLSATTLTGAAIGRAFASIPEECPMVNLSLAGSDFRDEELKYLAGFHRLRALHAGGVADAQDFAMVVSHLVELREVHYGLASNAAPESHDRVLESIGNLKCLETLTLYEPEISAQAFAKVAALPNLTSLFIERYGGIPPKMDVGVVDLIGGMTQLKSLQLYGEWVDDSSIRRLANLDRLENLQLATTHVSAVGLRQLAAQCELKCLDLTHTILTAESVEVLKTMDSLQHLELRGTDVTDQQLAELRKSLPHWQIDEK